MEAESWNLDTGFIAASFRTAEGGAPPNVHPWINKNTTSTMEDVYMVMEHTQLRFLRKFRLLFYCLFHLFPTEELEVTLTPLFVPDKLRGSVVSTIEEGGLQ